MEDVRPCPKCDGEMFEETSDLYGMLNGVWTCSDCGFIEVRGPEV